MDADTNDITSNGLNNALTRDGQGVPTANLPMAGFRHTGVQDGQSRSDYASLGQVGSGIVNWVIAGGTADAITAAYVPAITVLVDGQMCCVRATAANLTATPTFAPNGLTPQVITRSGGGALSPSDILGNFAEILLRYNLANTRWEFLNPAPARFSTGVVQLTLQTVADPGWIMANDGTIGNVASGATFASLAALTLYTLIWNNISDTWAPVTGGRGGSAALDWAALKPIALTKMLGRALAISGAGSGLTVRVPGQNLGEESHLLTVGEMPSHNHGGATGNHVHGLSTILTSGTFQNANITGGATGIAIAVSNGNGTDGATASISAQGGGGVHNIMQPTSFLNAQIKL